MNAHSEFVSDLIGAVSRHPLLAGGTWSGLDLSVEDLVPVVEHLLRPYPSLWNRRKPVLISLEEARGNIARHAYPTGGICLVRCAAPGRRILEFLIADRGAGFKIDGCLPPYGQDMIGREFEFRRTLDGTVSCVVHESDVLEIIFRRYPEDRNVLTLDDLPIGGMGLSIIAKVMDRVAYLSHVGTANLLWTQLRIPEGEAR